MSSPNTAIIKPDPMEMTFYYGDDYNFPIHANIMKMEMTPKKLTISPNSPLQVFLKNLAKKRQELVVQLNSFLFKIRSPRAFKGTKSQIYCIMEPGETLNFRIELMKETGPGFLESDVLAMANPEGIFTIFHQTTTKKDDSDTAWFGSLDSPHNTDKKSNDRIIKISVNGDFEHGFSEQQVFLESDSELTKKRRQQFDGILKNEKVRVENEEKEKEQAEKEKNEKKKRRKCVLM